MTYTHLWETACESAWRRAIYRSRQGPELGRALLLSALVVLLLEAAVASTGRLAGRGAVAVKEGHGAS